MKLYHFLLRVIPKSYISSIQGFSHLSWHQNYERFKMSVTLQKFRSELLVVVYFFENICLPNSTNFSSFSVFLSWRFEDEIAMSFSKKNSFFAAFLDPFRWSVTLHSIHLSFSHFAACRNIKPKVILQVWH